MKIFHSPLHALHRGKGELNDGQIMPCHENPGRAEAFLDAVRAGTFGDVLEPEDHGLTPILGVHTQAYVSFLRRAWAEWLAARKVPETDAPDALPLIWPTRTFRQIEPEDIDGRLSFYSMDAGTPVMKGTWDAVYAAAQCAVSTQRAVGGGDMAALSLHRPPGHHAAADLMGGYCYLNHAAIAAQSFIADGAKRAAVLDVDFHHGNGTQSIFYRRGDVMVVNIHADPAVEFPYFLGYADETGEGAGEGANVNLPLPLHTDWQGYSAAFDEAAARLAAFRPDALVLSLGFDTYAHDLLGRFALTAEDYTRLGARVAALNLPIAVILEGGYAVEALGSNLAAFLTGFLDRR